MLSEPSGLGGYMVCIWLLVSGSSGQRVSSPERFLWHQVANHAWDACRRLLLAVLSSAFNLGGLEHQCFLYFFYCLHLWAFHWFPPPPLFFFFFLLTATDVFVINYLVGIVWHKREYFTNDCILLLYVAFLPALLWSHPTADLMVDDSKC